MTKIADSSMNATRLRELDVLRGLAALSVMLFHYTSRFQQIYGHSGNLYYSFPTGHMGVNLFFVISGFVIYMTLNKCNKPIDFIMSRFSRLYPAYWFSVPFTYVIITIFHLSNREVTFKSALLNLSMIHFFFHVPNVDNVYWTLEVELLFYAVIFMLYLFGLLRRIDLIAVIWLMAAVVDKYYMPLPSYVEHLLIIPHCHLFIAGIMFFRIKTGHSHPVDWAIIAICFLIAVVPFTDMASIWWNFFIFTSFILVCYGLLSKLGSINLLVFLGNISYPLYLLHQNVGYVAIRYLEKTGLNCNISIIGAMVLLIAIASFAHVLIEKPARYFIKFHCSNICNGIELRIKGAYADLRRIKTST